MKGWIPRIGETVVVKGDGDKTRSIQGTVERVSKQNCGAGVIKLWLCGWTDPIIAQDSNIVRLKAGAP